MELSHTKNRSLWTAPVPTSQTILHCNSYVPLIIIRVVFNCSNPTVGINWVHTSPEIWASSNLSTCVTACVLVISLGCQTNFEHKRERYVQRMRSHLCTSEALAGRGLQGKWVFSVCKIRVEIFIQVDIERREVGEPWI